MDQNGSQPEISPSPVAQTPTWETTSSVPKAPANARGAASRVRSTGRTTAKGAAVTKTHDVKLSLSLTDADMDVVEKARRVITAKLPPGLLGANELVDMGRFVRMAVMEYSGNLVAVNMYPTGHASGRS